MKNFFTLLIVASSSIYAQIPTNYYNNATGDKFTLKTQLFTIISSNYSDRGYDMLRDLYRSTNSKNGFQDKYYEKDNTILDIYSENPTGTDPYNFNPNSNLGSGNEGVAYNREHLVPQSFFDEYQTYPMRSDAFHVWPTDSKVNGWRGNYAFGNVTNRDNATYCNGGGTNLPCRSLNGTTKGRYVSNASITVVEPIDEFKGDVARAFLYFATRYEDKLSNFYSSTNAEAKAMFDGSRNKAFTDQFLSTLITWHKQDPVSDRELDLNDLIYDYQGNRNPYIDHPEYVEKIWGTNLATDDFEYQKRDDIQVYNKTSRSVVVRLENSQKEIKKVSVFNLNGQLINEVINSNNQKEIEVSFNTPGVYIIKVVGKGMEINKRVVIK